MYSSPGYDPDNRHDVRSGPKPPGMGMKEYLGHVRAHSRKWYRSSMHKNVLDMVTTRIFVMMEDDYMPPEDAVEKLLNLLIGTDRAAVASAVQTYRCPHHGPMGIAPSEVVLMDHEKIIYKRCCPPGLKGVHEVEGTSFSCFAAKAEPYREAFRLARKRKLLMTYIGHDQVIMNCVRQLRWKVLVDFGVWGAHAHLKTSEIVLFGRDLAVQDEYSWDPIEGEYKYRRL